MCKLSVIGSAMLYPCPKRASPIWFKAENISISRGNSHCVGFSFCSFYYPQVSQLTRSLTLVKFCNAFETCPLSWHGMGSRTFELKEISLSHQAVFVPFIHFILVRQLHNIDVCANIHTYIHTYIHTKTLGIPNFSISY